MTSNKPHMCKKLELKVQL